MTKTSINEQKPNLTYQLVEEARYQYRLYLDTFDDVKKKINIYLIIITLIITLPLTNERLIFAINSMIGIRLIFFLGIILLGVSLILSIYTLKNRPAYLIKISSVLKKSKNVSEINSLIGIVHSYEDNINKLKEITESKSRLVNKIEILLVISTILILIAIITTLIGGI